jgi:hypothetical protein
MLQFHPPPNPLPSREGEHIWKSFAITSLFLDNFHHPSLRVKRITGTIDRWEGLVTMNYRFTFQFEAGRELFRRIGTNDILKKEN